MSKRGFIYKICDRLSDAVYYGSTVENLNQKLARYKRQVKEYEAGKRSYKTCFEIIKSGDAYIEYVEVVDFDDRRDLYERERYFIQSNPCVNMRVPLGKKYINK